MAVGRNTFLLLAANSCTTEAARGNCLIANCIAARHDLLRCHERGFTVILLVTISEEGPVWN